MSNSLPASWCEASLEEFCSIIQGQSPPGNTYNDSGDGLAFFQGKAEFGARYPIAKKWCSSPTKIAERDDVLISVRAPVGPTNLCPETACIGRGLAAIRALGGSQQLYVLYALQATHHRLKAEATGSTFEAISGEQLRTHKVPLAPVEEQGRIVAEIEALFSELESATAALKRVQANLKRYRASVLKAACEGRLVPTEAELARKEGRNFETGEQLLARVLKERRAKWESDQFSKMQAAGKLPTNDDWKKKKKYKEPDPPNNAILPELPEGWMWASIDGAAECLDGQRVPVNKEERARRNGNVPYYGANGQVGWIDDFLFDEPLVLVVEDETFVGRTIPFSYLIRGKSWVNNHAHVLRATGAVTPEFLNYSLCFYKFTPLTTGSTGRRKLTQKALMNAPYPLPPLGEQSRIVAEIERRLSNADEINESLEKDISRAESLRQAILKRAFEGKLVPQDPSDEPASVRLERIRVERATKTAPEKKYNLKRKTGVMAASGVSE